MQDLVIIGAGSFGEDMLDNIRIINEEEPRWNLLGFIDDTRTGDVDGVPILGNQDAFLQMDKHIQYFVAVMDGKVRERIMNTCRTAGFTGAVIVGEKAIIEENVTIGEGSYLGYKSHLMSGCRIGSGVILEHVCSVCGDAQIQEYTTCRIFNVVGRCAQIGKYCTFAPRCTVNDNIAIAEGCRFHIGSVVLENATVAGCYAGNPARLFSAAQ